MKKNQILVVIKEPGKEPYVEPLFSNTLEAFQTAVGGYIETVTVASDLVLIVNEEGHIHGLPDNVTILGCPFVGTVMAVGRRGDEFASIKAANVPTVMSLLRGDRQDVVFAGTI